MTDKTPRAWDGALEQEFYTPEEIAASDARVGKAQRGIDRAWIIEGLEFTLQESGWDANVAYDQELMIQVVTEAIALLKAQEPRVMTLEEIEDWDGAVFFEACETDMYYALIETVEPTAGMDGAFVFINVVPGEYHRRVWGGENYGSIWRCWTSRPTDEQREATPWE